MLNSSTHVLSRAVVQIHTWLYWGHMWHYWHLGSPGLLWAALGYLWEGTCANTHLDVLGPHVASMAPLAPLGPPRHADVYIYMWLGQ